MSLPHRLIAVLFGPVLAFALASCASTASREAPVASSVEPPLVILVSIDGFRADYLTRGETPVLAQLAEEGASGPMRPSWPSVTFPNHYTLVTGLHPDHHGIVGNRFYDPVLGTFTMSSKETAWWDGAEPIWVSAERAGVRTGTMFWPGSEAEIHGIRPSRWAPFDKDMSGDARVDQLLAWLDLPADQRPRFETLYFDIVDTAGHNAGPDSEEVAQALASVDVSIGRLVDGLKARGLYENTILVVVSDHGMAETSPERVVWIDDLVDPALLRIGYAGAVLTTDPLPGHEAEVRSRLIGRHPHMECWDKADVPARLAYGTHPRVASIVCLVETGWLAVTRERPVSRIGGAHGYDNQSPDMAAVFIAHGPGVIPGRRLENLDSVDVQPFLARLLGISAPEGDGNPEDTLPVTHP